MGFGVQPSGCTERGRLKPELQTWAVRSLGRQDQLGEARDVDVLEHWRAGRQQAGRQKVHIEVVCSGRGTVDVCATLVRAHSLAVKEQADLGTAVIGRLAGP